MSEKEPVRGSPSGPSNPKMSTRQILRKWLESEEYGEEKSKAEAMFDEIITNPSIKKVSKRLFMNGDYRNAVLDAMIQLDEMVKTRARVPKDDQDKEFSRCTGKSACKYSCGNPAYIAEYQHDNGQYYHHHKRDYISLAEKR